MKFLITITEQVIDKSAYCKKDEDIVKNCAFAVAYNELIPAVSVHGTHITFFERGHYKTLRTILAKKDQRDFIIEFDNMTPEARYSLVGREFEVEIPDAVIEYWHGDVVKAAQSIIDNPILKPLELV